MTKKTLVSPSILSADFLNLESELKTIEPESDFIHVDVMDGHFVPNLTIGPPVVRMIKSKCSKPLDVHIMVSNPDDVADQYLTAGADILTFHIEAAKDPVALAKKIRSSQRKAGVSLKPATPINAITSLLEHIDLILVMSVNPGFGGQKFIPESVEKITAIKKLLAEKNLHHVLIEVDGGINADTGKLAVDAGAHMLVAGNYIFNAPSRSQAIQSLRNL